MARPLSRLLPSDTRNLLSSEARIRLDSAHREADLIRQRILADCEVQLICLPKTEGSLQDLLYQGETGVLWQRAALEAARAVLLAAAQEYRAAGINGEEFRAVMKDELDSAEACLQLLPSQRRVLWTEIDPYNDPEPAPMAESEDGVTADSASSRERTHEERITLLENWRSTAGQDGGKLTWEDVAGKIHMHVSDLRAARANKPKANNHLPRLYGFVDQHCQPNAQ